MSPEDMCAGLAALEELKRRHAMCRVEVRGAVAEASDGYEYNTYNGMYIGRAVIVEVSLGDAHVREGGATFEDAMAAAKGSWLGHKLEFKKEK